MSGPAKPWEVNYQERRPARQLLIRVALWAPSMNELDIMYANKNATKFRAEMQREEAREWTVPPEGGAEQREQHASPARKRGRSLLSAPEGLDDPTEQH